MGARLGVHCYKNAVALKQSNRDQIPDAEWIRNSAWLHIETKVSPAFLMFGRFGAGGSARGVAQQSRTIKTIYSNLLGCNSFGRGAKQALVTPLVSGGKRSFRDRLRSICRPSAQRIWKISPNA